MDDLSTRVAFIVSTALHTTTSSNSRQDVSRNYGKEVSREHEPTTGSVGSSGSEALRQGLGAEAPLKLKEL